MKITLQIEDVSYLNAEPILSFASALEGDFFLIEEFSGHMLFFIDTIDPAIDEESSNKVELMLMGAYLDFGEALRDILYPDREKLHDHAPQPETAKTNTIVTRDMDVATAKREAQKSWKYTEVGRIFATQPKGKKVRGAVTLERAYIATLLKEAETRCNDDWENHWLIDKYYTVGRFDGSIASFKTIADKLEEYFNVGPQIANKLRQMILSQEP